MNEVSGLDVTAQLNHLLMPNDRGTRYEEPLQEALAGRGLGEVVGGGTLQWASGEIDSIDVQVTITDARRGLPFLIETLEALGAPKGSKLLFRDGSGVRELPFGKVEGVAVYLDGVNLRPSVYATSDVNLVIAELNRRLLRVGEMQSYWEGPKETALYFYGLDADEMKNRMADFSRLTLSAPEREWSPLRRARRCRRTDESRPYARRGLKR